ncbi:hypothetical protein LCGC14_1945690 [marine sediment metagenome]|uniref:Uncharacterized protein n=1 Tax=marine sediment metagenome TaxID=412755 RepID=A0A0F9FIY5_9ZZZZ
MVDLQTIGMGLTLILLVTSAFIGVIAVQEDNSFGLNEAVDQLTIDNEDIEDIIISFNSDFNTFSNSDGLNQIPLGATVIINTAKDTINFLSLAFFGWTIVITLLFGFSSDPNIIAFGGVLTILFGIIMIITIGKFLGGIIRSLPFFGGG